MSDLIVPEGRAELIASAAAAADRAHAERVAKGTRLECGCALDRNGSACEFCPDAQRLLIAAAGAQGYAADVAWCEFYAHYGTLPGYEPTDRAA